MTGVRCWFWATVTGLLFNASAMLPASAHTQTACLPAEPVILKPYIYGFAPVVMAAVRALDTATPDATSIPGRAPINQLLRGKTLATPSARLFARPSADTLFTQAWLDLAYEPIILHLPDTAGRYYLVPMLDAYSNVFASIGARTTGTGEGNYAIVGPHWHGRLHEPVSGIVRAPTNTVWLLGRTLVHGQADLANAVAVTEQYQLVPLTAYRHFLMTGSYTPPVNVPVTPPNPDFTAHLPIYSNIGFSKPEFFDLLLETSLRNPPPRPHEREAARLVGQGELLKSELTPDIVLQAVQAMACEEATTGTRQNGWTARLDIGNYGSNYLQRAATALFGLGANIPADAVYYSAGVDINHNALSATNNYVIHFAANQIPPVKGFWSITVYDGNGFLVANPINRYRVGSDSGLAPNADGSIDILLQNTPPATLQTNWLPTPAKAPFDFNLTLRLYWPSESILNGTYPVPGVQPAASAQVGAR
jgi:hypothetical protein